MTGRGRGRPPRKCGRGRGRATVISCGPTMSRFQRARALNSGNGDVVVDWLTQDSPSSSGSARNSGSSSFPSSSDSATQQATSRPAASTTAASLDVSEELFSHNFEAMTDAQPLVPDETPNVAPDGSDSGDITDVCASSNDDVDVVPAAVAFCEVSDTSDAAGDDDDISADISWVPARRPEEELDSSDGESERRRRRVASRGSSSSQSARGTARPHVSPAVVRPPICPSPPAVSGTIVPKFKSSAVWQFFCVSALDHSVAICNLCSKKLSRGKAETHFGTTPLRRHMQSHHKRQWDQHMRSSSTESRPPPTSPTPPPPPRPPPSSPAMSTCGALAPSQTPSSPPLTLSSTCSSALTQVSVKEVFARKKAFSPSHPTARRLSAALAELIARQLLPFMLVESEAFKKFMAVAVPQWKVPCRTFFSKKAIPNLYRTVERQVEASLAHSVGARVHLTTDTWSAKHGQGRYITYTAHWVTLQAPGKPGMRGAAPDLVSPPRLAGRPAATSSSSPPTPPSSSSLSSSAESSSCAAAATSCHRTTAQPQLPRAYAACQVQRCYAVLGMSCLKGESHTGPILLNALKKQVEQWLTPHQLDIDKVVCDNGSNLLAALNLGKLEHVPCMAHVINLVVQRFVSKFPGFQAVLKQSRKVCVHIRRSYPAKVRLSEIQRRNHLPVRRLVCDSPTRWNSTYHMFQRLLQQEKAVNEFLYDTSARTGSGELGIFLPRYWTLMRNACRLLRPLEEVTNLVSRSEAAISDLIPYTFFLERALRRVVDQAVDERDQEEEELWSPSPPPAGLSSSAPAGAAAEEEEEEEEEEDSEEEGGSYEEEEEPQQASQGAACPKSGSLGIVRGWGEEEEAFTDITEEERGEIASSASVLVQMGSFILSCLLKDPRIKRLKEKDLYWVATLLDPRYKQKVAEMLPSNQRTARMQHYQKCLQNMLQKAARGDGTIARQLNRGAGASSSPPPPPYTTESSGRYADVMVMADMRSFLSPTTIHSPSGSNARERLDRQVADYLALTADFDTMRSDEPLDYWVRRLDLWPELAQFAIQLLSCPASSVLSERTFSAAGGIVTDKRTRLGHQSVTFLTFLKMNEAWIPEGYCLSEDDL